MTSSNNPLDGTVAGYPRLAMQMGLVPEAGIFRTFSALNARNLLYLQAKLVALEKELLECELADSKVTEKARYALDWFWLNHSQQVETDPKQIRLVLEIQGKLKEYNEALIQASTLAGMKKADKWDIDFLQRFLMTKDMGSLALVGDDATTWGSLGNSNGYSPDLVALRPRHNEDLFSGWVAKNAAANFFLSCCTKFRKPSPVHGVVGFEDSTIFRVTAWITSILASLLLIASIVVLYVVHPMKAKLGIIASFNLLVSTCLSTFTKAKRAEVFAVTTAFAAVQVVFVSNDGKACSASP